MPFYPLFQYQAHTEPVILPTGRIESLHHQPWSEPVVKAKIGLRPDLQQFLAQCPRPPLVSFSWFEELSKPSVLAKPGILSDLPPFFFEDTKLIPDASKFLEGWFNWYSEPVRFKQGLSAPLQQFFTYPPRLLPTPNVSISLSAFEVNTDIPLFALNVIQSQPAVSAKVSVQEALGQSVASVREK